MSVRRNEAHIEGLVQMLQEWVGMFRNRGRTERRSTEWE